MQNSAEMVGSEFDPSVKGEGGDPYNENEYTMFGANNAQDMYDSLDDRLAKGWKDTHGRKVGSGEGMSGFEEFGEPSKYKDVPEGVIDDVMQPGSESEDVLYGMAEASSRGAEGGKEGARDDVRSARPITSGKESEDIYDVLSRSGGGKPKAIIKEKEKTAVIPGGLAKNPFPEDSKLGKMFRAIEARGKPGGHGLGKVKRPRI